MQTSPIHAQFTEAGKGSMKEAYVFFLKSVLPGKMRPKIYKEIENENIP
jgi:hypothetical protein